MAVKTDPKLTEPFEDGGPGAHLRRVREEANISIDKIATSLLLDPKTIEALEADSFDRLPAPTFVRGYLRGYARLLGLPAEPILEMYNRHGFQPPPLAPDVTETQQAHTSDTAVRLVTYAVGVMLVVLVGLWWNSQEDGGFGIGGDLFDWLSNPAPSPSLPGASAPGTAPIDGEVVGESIAMAPDRTNESPQNDGPPAASADEDAAPGDTATTDDQAGAVSVAMAPNRTNESLQDDEPSPDNEPPTASSDEDVAPGNIAAAGPVPAVAAGPGTMTDRGTPATPAARSEIAAGPDPAAETDSTGGDRRDAPAPPGTVAANSANALIDTTLSAATPPAMPGTSPAQTARNSTDTGPNPPAGLATTQARLILEFVHESWVEVYDRERTRLFFGLVQPGRLLSFDGAQPFDVLLGFGKDVRVAIDGESFDHEPYMKHGVARFSVGSAPESDGNVAESAGTAAPDSVDSRAESPLPAEPSWSAESSRSADSSLSQARGR